MLSLHRESLKLILADKPLPEVALSQWFYTIRILRGQHIATFHEPPIDLDGSH
jgi:hypothetical protein